MKKIWYIIKIALILAGLRIIFSFIVTVTEYNTILDNINNVEKEDLDFYEQYKNQDLELYAKNTNMINMLINSKGSHGKIISFYENGKIKTELDCSMQHITFLELFINMLIMPNKIEKIKYSCKRTQYYKNGNKMLFAQYQNSSKYSYDENMYHFIKEEISRFYNDIRDLCVHYTTFNKLIGASVVYYENIPKGIENAPMGANVCVHKGLLSGNDSLCRKEEYTKYQNNNWNVVEYFPNGHLKSNLTYKNLDTDEIISGKVFHNNGRSFIEYVDDGKRVLFYNLYGKLYKEINKEGKKTKNIKIYSSNGDLKYILFFKNNEPIKGYKYEKGNETPLTNAHIYNIFKIKANIE